MTWFLYEKRKHNRSSRGYLMINLTVLLALCAAASRQCAYQHKGWEMQSYDLYILTHYGIVMPYGYIDLRQH